MRTIEVPFPLRVYLVAIPGIAGALVAGSGAWTLAFVLFGISLGVYIGVMVWWTRRVNAIRRSEGLTSRDLIKPTFPKWARSIAIGYLGVLAAMTGGFILLMVVFLVVLVAAD